MLPELPGLWSLSPIAGIVGMLLTFYWLLSTGRIITRSSHERELGLSNKRGDEWKETALEGRKLIQTQAEQNRKLIESNSIVDHFFRSVGGGMVDENSHPRPGGPYVP